MRERLDAGRATTEDALELFDSLEPVDVGFMIGNWKGEGFHTNHPMDGLLEAYHWSPATRYRGVDESRPPGVLSPVMRYGQSLMTTLPRARWLAT